MKLLNCLLVREKVQTAKIDLEDVPLKVRGFLVELANELNQTRKAVVSLHNINEQILINEQS